MRVAIVAPLLAMSLCLAPADDEREEMNLQESSYRVILERNPFGLRAPEPEPEPEPPPPEPPKPPVSLDQFNLTMAGISSVGRDSRVWLSLTVPGSEKDGKAQPRSFGLRENDGIHGITIRKIDPRGVVEIEYEGVPLELTFETHGNKTRPQARKAAAPAPKGSTPPPGRNRSIPSRNTRTPPPNTDQRNIRTSPGRTTTRYSPGTSAPRSVPRLSRDQQVASMMIQNEMARREGRSLPPMPPLRPPGTP